MILAHTASAQTFSDEISKVLAFEKRSPANALIIANIFGGVKVTAYDGDQVLVEVTRSISAKTEARLEKGKTDLQLGILDRADTLILYVRDGCHEFTQHLRGKHTGHGEWGYEGFQKDCSLAYDYELEFVVKVPVTVNISVSTINDGDIVIENAMGVVKARNVNGGIKLENLRNQAEAQTVNGNVDVTYAQNPGKECRFYSLNGDINALFQPGLSARVGFESFNGSFYTNITRLEHLPATVEKSNHGDGMRYKIDGNRFKVGEGGALLDFETFNGNVYLKEKIN